MREEWRHYKVALIKKWPQILLAGWLAAGGAYIFSSGIEEEYSVFYTYTVSLSEREVPEGGDYAFDGFYALQSTDMFTASLARWVQAPELVVRAYDKAGLAVPGGDPRVLAKSVIATKTAPQVVEVRVNAGREEYATRLAKALRQGVEEQISRYHSEGVPSMKYRVVATEPWTGVTRIGAGSIALAVFMATIIIALNVVLFIESVKR